MARAVVSTTYDGGDSQAAADALRKSMTGKTADDVIAEFRRIGSQR